MKKNAKKYLFIVVTMLFTGIILCGCGKKEETNDNEVTLYNVSYDPTREFYEEYNTMFTDYYKEQTGKTVKVIQSHGGSGSQARSVVEGADADVVTLALALDVSSIEKNGLIDEGWENEFEQNSSPYTSSIVLLVRKGNEKEIKDWDDLTKDGVEIITPDPKSSGGARWNFLAAWYYGEVKYNNDEEKIKEFVKQIYANVIVMDSGARGATTTFVENKQGDVLIAWENEAIATMKEYPDEYEIISPSVSILAQPSVAIVDKNAKKDGVEDVAKAYLNYLYSKPAQQIMAKYGYRPSDEEVLQQFADTFDLNMKLCSIDDFGGWNQANEKFFADDAIFDHIYSR